MRVPSSRSGIKNTQEGGIENCLIAFAAPKVSFVNSSLAKNESDEMGHRVSLRWMGVFLFVLGFIPFVPMAWFFALSTFSFSWMYQSFGIWPILAMVSILFVPVLFFLVPAVLVFRGNLRATKYFQYLALMALGWFVIELVPMPFMAPFDFYLVLLKLAPGTIILWFLERLPFVGFFYWLQYMLGRPAIIAAQINRQINPTSIYLPFSIGCFFHLIFLVAACGIIHGETGKRAIQHAEADHGTRYKYFVTAVQYTRQYNGTTTTAWVTGYNSLGIENFVEQWSADSPVSGR
jgi:hypothetical protein